MKKLLLLAISVSISAFSFGQNAAFKEFETMQKTCNDLIALQKKGGDMNTLSQMLPTANITLMYNTNTTQYDSVTRVVISDYDSMGFAATNTEQEYINNSWRNKNLQYFKIEVDTTGGNLKFKIDSVKFSSWDTINNEWVLSSKSIYTNNPTTWQPLTATTYLNSAMYGSTAGIVIYSDVVYYYDVNNFLIADAASALDFMSIMIYPYTPAYLMGDSTEYTNDSNGNPTTTVRWEYDENNMVRVMNEKTLNTYDSNGNVTEEIGQEYDTTSVTWINYEKHSYTYDSNNNMTGEVNNYWDTQTSAWANNDQTSYTYDANNNETERITMIWDFQASAFNNNSRKTIAWNTNDDETLIEEYSWTGSAWDKNFRTTFTYLSGGEKDAELDEWSVDNGANWTPVDAGNPSQEEKRVWIYTTIVTSVPSFDKMDNIVSVYPNPSTGLVSISMGENFKDGLVTINVYNIFGQLIYNSNTIGANNLISLNLETLASGSYILEISNESNISTEKLIIR